MVSRRPPRRPRRARSRAGWHRGLDWGPRGIVCTRSGARTSPRVVSFPPADAPRVLAAPQADEPEAWRPPEPGAVEWVGVDGVAVHGLLWRAAGGASSPVVVDLHGGPTGQALADWTARVRFLWSRGWTVLCPNPRGSSGYGRVYERAVTGRWGLVDRDDVVAGIGAISRFGWGDAERVALIGGSAGACIALLVAADPRVHVGAVVSQYGVTDLEGLAAARASRFESHYLDDLVGPLPATQDQYRARSPIAHVDGIRCPVLVLHGGADQVVPLAQSTVLVDRLRGAGVAVDAHVYAGEGHGWSRAATIADALDRIADFLHRHLLAGTPATRGSR